MNNKSTPETVERQAIADDLTSALVERNVDRYNSVAFLYRHKIIAALSAPSPASGEAVDWTGGRAWPELLEAIAQFWSQWEEDRAGTGTYLPEELAEDGGNFATELADHLAALAPKPDEVTVPEGVDVTFWLIEREDSLWVANMRGEVTRDANKALMFPSKSEAEDACLNLPAQILRQSKFSATEHMWTLQAIAPKPSPDRVTEEEEEERKCTWNIEKSLERLREIAAQEAYRICAETRHITLGDKVAKAIRLIDLERAK